MPPRRHGESIMPAGLKEGGHHRKEVDVQRAKRQAKKAAADAKAAAGERCALLLKLLTLDPDLDVFLEKVRGRRRALSTVIRAVAGLRVTLMFLRCCACRAVTNV